MATVAEQTTCERCKEPLVPEAAYCEKCGERTRKARRMVRLAIRVELLLVAMVIVLVLGFAWIYAAQKP
jgi:uncharacterized OB-fold protein